MRRHAQRGMAGNVMSSRVFRPACYPLVQSHATGSRRGIVTRRFLGTQVYARSLPAADDLIVSSYNESGPVVIEAGICEEPESGGRYTSLLMDDIRVTEDGSQVAADGRVLLTTSDPRPFHYGDAVLFRGTLETPRAFDGFDYPRYLALSGVYSTAFQGTLDETADEPRPSYPAPLKQADLRCKSLRTRGVCARSLLLKRGLLSTMCRTHSCETGKRIFAISPSPRIMSPAIWHLLVCYVVLLPYVWIDGCTVLPMLRMNRP